LLFNEATYCSSAVTEDGDDITVASEIPDFVSDPFDGRLLVPEAPVSRCVAVQRCEEAEHVEAVVGRHNYHLHPKTLP